MNFSNNYRGTMKYTCLFLTLLLSLVVYGQQDIDTPQETGTIADTAPIAHYNTFRPGKLLFDNNGHIVNAHSAGLLYHDGTYYWFGEHKSEGIPYLEWINRWKLDIFNDPDEIFSR